ncbi:Metallo-beta-lactamase superfamily protein [Mycena kentingensis (nom. inval.)]|nr:Metallo-beta-lactamase superfamily protein [Mycena kentingensis (nom. inval.)]
MLSPSAITTLLALATGALASWQSLGIPSSHSGATISVKAFNVGNLTIGGTRQIVQPVLPGRESTTVPMFAFLLEHKSGKNTRRFMWDLGLRKDPQNSVPSVAALFDAFPGALDEPKDIAEVLVEGGIALMESIEAVMWSHAHIDHFGDMSRFPNSTGIIVGGATNTSIFPDNPNSQLQASDFAGHNLTRIDFSSSKVTIGSLKAIDFFKDSSLFLLDTPGHVAGHMTALATPRTTSAPPAPPPLLQKHFPCPLDIAHASSNAVSTDFFWSPASALGAFDIASRAPPMLALSDTPDSLYADPALARVSLDKLSTFDADADVLLVIAHDASILGALPVFPQSLNGWWKSGLKERVVWRFLEERNLAFVFSPGPVVNGTAS